MYRRFRRWIPATESGHGRSRHQTRASLDLVGRETGDAVRDEKLLQSRPIDRVDGGPRDLSAIDPVHARTVCGLPLVEKPDAVERGRPSIGERPELGENARPPVDDRAVGIEGERANRQRGRLRVPAPNRSMPSPSSPGTHRGSPTPTYNRNGSRAGSARGWGRAVLNVIPRLVESMETDDAGRVIWRRRLGWGLLAQAGATKEAPASSMAILLTGFIASHKFSPFPAAKSTRAPSAEVVKGASFPMLSASTR